MPGLVAFPLSLPGPDRASSVLPRGQQPGFFGPTETLGQSGPAGARGVVLNKDGVSPASGERQCRGSFHKVSSYNTSIKDF